MGFVFTKGENNYTNSQGRSINSIICQRINKYQDIMLAKEVQVLANTELLEFTIRAIAEGKVIFNEANFNTIKTQEEWSMFIREAKEVAKLCSLYQKDAKKYNNFEL